MGIELALALAESGLRSDWTRVARCGRAQETLCPVLQGVAGDGEARPGRAQAQAQAQRQRLGMVWHGTDAGGGCLGHARLTCLEHGMFCLCTWRGGRLEGF